MSLSFEAWETLVKSPIFYGPRKLLVDANKLYRNQKVIKGCARIASTIATGITVGYYWMTNWQETLPFVESVETAAVLGGIAAASVAAYTSKQLVRLGLYLWTRHGVNPERYLELAKPITNFDELITLEQVQKAFNHPDIKREFKPDSNTSEVEALEHFKTLLKHLLKQKHEHPSKAVRHNAKLALEGFLAGNILPYRAYNISEKTYKKESEETGVAIQETLAKIEGSPDYDPVRRPDPRWFAYFGEGNVQKRRKHGSTLENDMLGEMTNAKLSALKTRSEHHRQSLA